MRHELAIMDHGKVIAAAHRGHLVAPYRITSAFVELSTGDAARAVNLPALRQVVGVREPQSENSA